MNRSLIFIAVLSIISACTSNPPNHKKSGNNAGSPVESIKFKVVNTFPHDKEAFTEGFLFYNNQLFESTGSPEESPKARSVFGPVNMKTGIIDVKVELDRSAYFGEGIVILNGKVFQLTYKNQKGFIYDFKTFNKTGTFNYSNKEGWGLTTDGKSIIMSDGTDVITYLDPDSLKTTKKLNVTFNGSPAMYINELEFINGFIYANIWTTNNIAKIDPLNGKVIGIINLTSIFQEARKQYKMSEATNGIAFDSSKDRIFVTGKFWPAIFEIEFSH